MAFVERQKNLLRTGEFSDFIFNVGGRDFKVHRSIICPQSSVLHRLCTSNFKEGLEGRGSLPEENADIFERVLEFIYTGEYDPSPSETEDVGSDNVDKSGSQGAPDMNEDEAEASRQQCEPLLVVSETNEDETEASRQQSEQLMIHTGVYLLANYLDVSDLMQHAISKFRNLVKGNFRADAFVEPFAQVFKTDGDSGLRSQILELCLENSEHLSQEGELTLLLLQHEPIAWRMLLRQANEHTHQVEGAAELQRMVHSDQVGS